MPRLIGVEGPYSGQVFLLTAPITVVGRDPDRDIVLTADATISRNHARLVNEGGTFAVYDNGSSNGTFVNSLRIDMQVLRTGDIVQFGSSKFRFE
jgi:pSer/pThr/pTyr-binding forkhead associated (FHA) protein